MTTSTPVAYVELARLFLRLSLTAFGGPVAHIAIAEDEIVTRRRWLTREHFLDLIAATNLIPGPNSTEVMIHVGYTLRGVPGAVLTGACFIIPAFLLTLALSVLYVSTGSIPQVDAVLWGIKPVIVAIIANVAYRLILTALKSPILWLVFGLSMLALIIFNVSRIRSNRDARRRCRLRAVSRLGQEQFSHGAVLVSPRPQLFHGRNTIRRVTIPLTPPALPPLHRHGEGVRG
jgi:chromate transporter